jgi:hypothetical protein
MEFKKNLSYEYWADVFNINDDLNAMFNNFLNSYIRIFNNRFPYKKFISIHTSQPWLTIGIKVSCARKRELYLLSRNIDDLELTRYYKKYCKVLTEVIKLAKHCYYNKLISNSKNKIKTSWSIIRSVTNTNSEKNPIPIIISKVNYVTMHKLWQMLLIIILHLHYDKLKQAYLLMGMKPSNFSLMYSNIFSQIYT